MASPDLTDLRGFSLPVENCELTMPGDSKRGALESSLIQRRPKRIGAAESTRTEETAATETTTAASSTVLVEMMGSQLTIEPTRVTVRARLSRRTKSTKSVRSATTTRASMTAVSEASTAYDTDYRQALIDSATMNITLRDLKLIPWPICILSRLAR
ncbi:hypothetical protein L228DRAFT_51643 [Xylona heveae TC161]|uniref:Uncharacterized protein n=1 Tax=Xylona heveae (strain CBS 132557 / TC161) TaxID=1328760 RepID=A0A164ZDN8_XYLHT|nr:hypothetical protein L228DRAFT_51643 [Xylona heveae TC161]KZF18971.1 hypothetical protein L228DRAFT_51643 [Xylona heveae TC161]